MADGADEIARLGADGEQLCSRIPPPEPDRACDLKGDPGGLFDGLAGRDTRFGFALVALEPANCAHQAEHRKQRGGDEKTVDRQTVQIAETEERGWPEDACGDPGIRDMSAGDS